MLKIEDAEIGMMVMTKNHGEGVIEDFYVTDTPVIHAWVRTTTGELVDCYLFDMSRLTHLTMHAADAKNTRR